MLKESMVGIGGLTTAGLSVGGTDALTKSMAMFQDSNELTFVMWVVGGLLALISLLLVVISYFIWSMRTDNREDHKELYSKIESPETGLEPRLSKLEAYDAEHMKTMITGAVAEALKARRENQ